MRPDPLRLARGGVALLVVGFVARAIAANWSDLQHQSVAWTFRPVPAVASVVLVWTMYAMLIATWRRVLMAWGERLDGPAAARIWMLSSLGKYVPGKVWAITGMAIMARTAGVSAWAATGSAVLLQVLAVATGAVVAAVAGGAALAAYRPGLPGWLWAGGAVALGVTLAAASPPVVRRLASLVRFEAPPVALGFRTLASGLAANLLAWLGYGAAFWLLAQGVLPASRLEPAQAIAAFAASYVVGLIALFAPGGLIVREGVMVALLQSPLGLGPATALAVASRVLLTLTEVGAALPFLIFRWGDRRGE